MEGHARRGRSETNCCTYRCKSFRCNSPFGAVVIREEGPSRVISLRHLQCCRAAPLVRVLGPAHALRRMDLWHKTSGCTPSLTLSLLYVPPLRHVTSCCINRLHPASRIGMPM